VAGRGGPAGAGGPGDPDGGGPSCARSRRPTHAAPRVGPRGSAPGGRRAACPALVRRGVRPVGFGRMGCAGRVAAPGAHRPGSYAPVRLPHAELAEGEGVGRDGLPAGRERGHLPARVEWRAGVGALLPTVAGGGLVRDRAPLNVRRDLRSARGGLAQACPRSVRLALRAVALVDLLARARRGARLRADELAERPAFWRETGEDGDPPRTAG